MGELTSSDYSLYTLCIVFTFLLGDSSEHLSGEFGFPIPPDPSDGRRVHDFLITSLMRMAGSTYYPFNHPGPTARAKNPSTVTPSVTLVVFGSQITPGVKDPAILEAFSLAYRQQLQA